MKKNTVLLVLLFVLCILFQVPLFSAALTEIEFECVEYRYSHSVYSIEEYNRYIQDMERYRSFVPYEDVSFLGEFLSFHLPYYHGYEYVLKIESGNEILFGAEEGNCLPHDDPSFDLPTEGSLFVNEIANKHVPSSFLKTTYALLDGFCFCYGWDSKEEHMELEKILWYNAVRDVTYELYFQDGYLPDKTNADFESGFYAELLNRSTWEKARDRLLTATGSAPVSLEEKPTTDTSVSPTPFPWLWVILPAGAVLIIAAAVVLFIRKKKTQK